MNAGCIFTYSPYMLTHQQQIKNEINEMDALINIVSYNSEHLFNIILWNHFCGTLKEIKNYFEKIIY